VDYLSRFLFIPNFLVIKLLIFHSFYLNFTFTNCVLYVLFICVFFLELMKPEFLFFLLCYYEFSIINAQKL